MISTNNQSDLRIDRRLGPIAGRYVLFREMVRKQLLLMLRYRVNFAASLVSMYLFFAAIFFGGQVAVSQVEGGIGALSSTFDGLIVGWFLWTMAQSAYSGLQGDVTAESRWGTLEQLYMSPYGFGWVMSLKAIVNVLLSFFFGVLMLALMLVTTQRGVTVDPFTVIPLVVLSLIPVLGLGYAIAGLSLIYKKISNLSSLVNMALIAFIAAPAADQPMLNVLPLVKGSELLQAAMRDGVSIRAIPPAELLVLVSVAAAYFLVGYAVFVLATGVARSRGVMGHY